MYHGIPAYLGLVYTDTRHCRTLHRRADASSGRRASPDHDACASRYARRKRGGRARSGKPSKGKLLEGRGLRVTVPRRGNWVREALEGETPRREGTPCHGPSKGEIGKLGPSKGWSVVWFVQSLPHGEQSRRQRRSELCAQWSVRSSWCARRGTTGEMRRTA